MVMGADESGQDDLARSNRRILPPGNGVSFQLNRHRGDQFPIGHHRRIPKTRFFSPSVMTIPFSKRMVMVVSLLFF